MKGFKKCEIGHFFKDDLDFCPYCPSNNANNATQITNPLSDKTQITGGNTNLSDKTQIIGSGGDMNQSTQIFGGGNNINQNSKKDLNRTFIQGMEINDEGKNVINETARQSRKIVGWIISYSLDAMGLDFRIYEGNNTIGRDPENTITIANDSAISGKHVTVLFRMNKFYIKDEMAVNGTFINNELIDIGKPYELNDGDTIRLGGTTLFKFKSAL
jgi:hypothetical protein